MKALFTSFCFSLALLLAACGDNASGPAIDTPTGSASANSNVVKGVIRNGIVTAKRWQDGTYVDVASARTNTAGSFTLSIPDAVPGEVLRLDLSLSSDSSQPTEMLCDAVACGDKTFGEWAPLTVNPGLASWASVDASGNLTIMPMTVVSTLLVDFAEAVGGGHIDAAAIGAARQRVAALFGMNGDALMARPGNIVDSAWLAAASDSSLRLSLLSAAFAQLAEQNGVALDSLISNYVQAFVANGGHLLQDGGSESLGEVYRGIAAIAASAGSAELQGRVSSWLTNLLANLNSGLLNSSACSDCGSFDSNAILATLGTGPDTLGGDLQRVLLEHNAPTLEALLAQQLAQYGWLASQDSVAVAGVAAQAVAFGLEAALGTQPAPVNGLTPVLDGNVLHVTGNQNGLDVDLDLTVPNLLTFITSYQKNGPARFTIGASGSLANERIRASIDGSLAINADATNFLPLKNAFYAFFTASTPEAQQTALQSLMQAVAGILRTGQASFTLEGSAGIAKLELQGDTLAETSRLAIEGKGVLQVDMAGGSNGAIAASGSVEHGRITLPTGDTFEVDPAQGHSLSFALAGDGTAQATFAAYVLGHSAAVSGSGRLAGLGTLLGNLRDSVASGLETGALDLNTLLAQLLTDVGNLRLSASGQAEIPDFGHHYTMTLADGHMKISQPNSSSTALDVGFSSQGLLLAASNKWWLFGLDLSGSSPALTITDSSGGEWTYGLGVIGLGDISASPGCWGSSQFC